MHSLPYLFVYVVGGLLPPLVSLVFRGTFLHLVPPTCGGLLPPSVWLDFGGALPPIVFPAQGDFNLSLSLQSVVGARIMSDSKASLYDLISSSDEELPATSSRKVITSGPPRKFIQRTRNPHPEPIPLLKVPVSGPADPSLRDEIVLEEDYSMDEEESVESGEQVDRAPAEEEKPDWVFEEVEAAVIARKLKARLAELEKQIERISGWDGVSKEGT